MELGATVCLPKNPLCLICPVASACRALAEGTALQLPVKLRRAEPVALESMLLVVQKGGRVLLRQREADARRMAGFWELPTPEQLPRARVGRRLGAFRHTITHHHYTFGVAEASATAGRPPFQWHHPRDLANLPVSTTARKALKIAGILEP
jgi:A/G-specific adenine glycosylase